MVWACDEKRELHTKDGDGNGGTGKTGTHTVGQSEG